VYIFIPQLLQSTHPQRCDITKKSSALFFFASIHSPTRGATLLLNRHLLCLSSFNPCTHTGCDKRQNRSEAGRTCFNPRTHTGCDLLAVTSHPICTQFQSTHQRGVRQSYSKVRRNENRFQSTHPYGVRLSHTPQYYNTTQRFNPRTHAGCDRLNK